MAKLYKIEYSYASAILELESKSIKKIRLESMNLIEIIDSNPSLMEFLSSRNNSVESKEKFVDELFKSKINNSILVTIKLLINKNKANILKGILENVVSMCNDKLNIEEGNVYTTIKLTSKDIKELETKLSKKIQKEIYLKNKIDNFILGGIKVVVGDKVWDSSVVKKIQSLKEELKEKELL